MMHKYYFLHISRIASSQGIERVYTRLDLKPTDIDSDPIGSKWMQNLKQVFRPFFVSIHRSRFQDSRNYRRVLYDRVSGFAGAGWPCDFYQFKNDT